MKVRIIDDPSFVTCATHPKIFVLVFSDESVLDEMIGIGGDGAVDICCEISCLLSCLYTLLIYQDIIQQDISQGQYFVTGALTKSIYRDDCK